MPRGRTRRRGASFWPWKREYFTHMVIDIHSHIYPRRYLDTLAQRTEIPKLEVKEDGEHFLMFPDEKQITGGTRAIGDNFFSIEKKIHFCG